MRDPCRDLVERHRLLPAVPLHHEHDVNILAQVVICRSLFPDAASATAAAALNEAPGDWEWGEKKSRELCKKARCSICTAVHDRSSPHRTL